MCAGSRGIVNGWVCYLLYDIGRISLLELRLARIAGLLGVYYLLGGTYSHRIKE